MRGFLSGLAFVAAVWAGCTDSNILYCDENKPCRDPDRPFCDLRGEHGGQAHECIQTPSNWEAGVDGSGRDAGPDADTVVDAPDQALGDADATTEVDETLLFRALSVPSSTHNAPQRLRANGIEVSPEFVFYGEGATGTDWKAAVGQNLALSGSGAAPLPQWGVPLLGSEDDSIKFQRGKYYQSIDEALGKIADEDFVIETVFRVPEDLTSEEQLLGVGRLQASHAGYALRFTGEAQLVFAAHDTADRSLRTTSEALTPGTWNHALVVAHRSGSLQVYINGSASGSPVNISSMTSLSTASERLALGAVSNGGAQASGAVLAHAALWKRKAWLDSHLQEDVARERFHRMIGVYPQVAQGTALAEIAKRESDAYLDKIETDGSRRLYRVGRDWLRLVSRIDAKGQRITGLLSEKPATNLELYSERETQGTQDGVTIIANTHLAPDGRRTADTIREDASEGFHGSIGTRFEVEPGTFYACSVFIKPLNRTKVSLEGSNVSVALTSARFNLETGKVEGTSGAQFGHAYIEPHANGFFRCVMTFLATEGESSNLAGIGVYVRDDSWKTAFKGQDRYSVAVWGRQCETYPRMPETSLTRATSYVQSDGEARSRAVDALAYTADDGNFDERSGRIELWGLVNSEPLGTLAKAISLREGDYHWLSISVLAPSYGGVRNEALWRLAHSGGTAAMPNEAFSMRAWWNADTQGLATTTTQSTAEASQLPRQPSVLYVGGSQTPEESLNGVVADVRVHKGVQP